MSKNETSKGAGSSGVTFASRSPNFTLFLDSGRPVPGQNGQIEYKDRITIRFQNNRYSTSDRSVITAMRMCKSYGKQFQEVNEPARAEAAGAAAPAA
ncbi:MAG: hypothetical protein IT430_09840 [Phycisphaerales bacterium]|nr:hypothetical protein [Phycisphaerales bacterium]